METQCSYNGATIEHEGNVESLEACQKRCEFIKGCKYWQYDKEKNDCELLDSDDRVCDASTGSSKPSYEECFPGMQNHAVC